MDSQEGQTVAETQKLLFIKCNTIILYKGVFNWYV